MLSTTQSRLGHFDDFYNGSSALHKHSYTTRKAKVLSPSGRQELQNCFTDTLTFHGASDLFSVFPCDPKIECHFRKLNKLAGPQMLSDLNFS